MHAVLTHRLLITRHDTLASVHDTGHQKVGCCHEWILTKTTRVWCWYEQAGRGVQSKALSDFT